MTQEQAQQLLNEHQKFIKTTTFVHIGNGAKMKINDIKIFDNPKIEKAYQVICDVEGENGAYPEDLLFFLHIHQPLL